MAISLHQFLHVLAVVAFIADVRLYHAAGEIGVAHKAVLLSTDDALCQHAGFALADVADFHRLVWYFYFHIY